MDCLQLRCPPGQFHYLISEQAKSLVALQELQNEVGALLEFRDLVIETFPNLRSKMAPSTPASGSRREWEPGVRVRRKLAGGGGEARAKPQPSVQDSGFSTETSCGKDAHSSASATASASRSRPLEDELWALLDVIQRKGVRLREEAEVLRSELDERHSAHTAEESFVQDIEDDCGKCGAGGEVRRLRAERDALLARTAQLEADAEASAYERVNFPTVSGESEAPSTLGRLDSVLGTPAARVPAPHSGKFAAILRESNPVELQRQLLSATVHSQVLTERLKHAATQRHLLLEKLDRAREVNEDLKFRLDEKIVELDSVKTIVKQFEDKQKGNESLERRERSHSSMREMEPLPIPDGEGDAKVVDTPRRRPSRIPLHTANKGAAPRPPQRSPAPPRPPSAHSQRSSASGRGRPSRDTSVPPAQPPHTPAATGRRPPAAHHDKVRRPFWNGWFGLKDSGS